MSGIQFVINGKLHYIQLTSSKVHDTKIGLKSVPKQIEQAFFLSILVILITCLDMKIIILLTTLLHTSYIIFRLDGNLKKAFYKTFLKNFFFKIPGNHKKRIGWIC